MAPRGIAGRLVIVPVHDDTTVRHGARPVRIAVTQPVMHIALNLARPWRASALEGEIYRSRRVP